MSCLRQGDAGRQDTSKDLKCVCVAGLAVLCMLSLACCKPAMAHLLVQEGERPVELTCARLVA